MCISAKEIGLIVNAHAELGMSVLRECVECVLSVYLEQGDWSERQRACRTWGEYLTCSYSHCACLCSNKELFRAKLGFECTQIFLFEMHRRKYIHIYIHA
jgi:hypothetical protein